MTGMTAKPLVAGALPTKPADHRYWGNLHGAAGALAIFESACQHDGLTLVIAIDNAEAQRLEQALRFFLGQQTLGGRTPELLSLPDWETLPYDLFSPHPDIVSERIRTLHRLTQSRHGILVMPARTLLQRLAPQSYLSGNTLMLKVGQTLDGEKWRARLDAAGYRHSETVYEHGEYAVRGAILDVFPMGADTPYRIELFDNEVETLRTFDPETQRTLDKIERVELLPANEFPWHKDARQQFRLRWHEQFPGAAKECPLYQDVLSGLKPAGIEYYLPLFFDTCATLFDYVPAQTLIFTPAELESVLNQVQQDVQARYEDRRHDRLRPILPPGSLFMRTDECFSQLKAYPRITLFKDAQPEQTRAWNAGAAALPAVAIDGRAAEPLALLRQTLAQPGIRTLLCAETAGRREALQERLRAEGISVAEVSDWHAFLHGSDASAITLAAIEEGLWLPELGVRVIAEAELFGQRVMQRRRRERATEPSDMAFRSLAELRIGSPVVHIDHGVGRYQGLQTLDVDGQATEFLTLSYADGARLYVPVSNLHLISRYSGADDELAPLHKLGSDRWSQTRQKALERIRDTAAELLDVYARREAREGHRFPPPDDAYHAFCAGFPFEETTDQLAAIDAVIRDLTSPRPMDRLVCGDVGFGKTEVAMRAAFLVVNGGRQVAVLVPTTLLAQQHFESFRDRFAETAVKIELLSRFRTGKQQEQALASIAEGKADIIIGTHKLLSGDIRFHNLGLVIIDEE
ncbi:MAG: DEAD/DEAH box helicase, partial [Gammaproteobacteria bacterium]|nr:DEAD/DEAH box helicase [Gammaproteobacteria bacterium]